jgi:hypothetical protein
MAPNRDVVKPKFVPPQVQHGLINSQDSFFRDRGRGRHELAQPVVDEDSLPLIDPRQEMPQRECIAVASLALYDRHIVCALLWLLSAKSNLAKAERNSVEASSKYGVPGPTFGRVAQAAPAGMKDSWPFSLNPTHPMQVRTMPAPESSTYKVQAQPRSTVTADGVSTTNSPGGAQI